MKISHNIVKNTSVLAGVLAFFLSQVFVEFFPSYRLPLLAMFFVGGIFYIVRDHSKNEVFGLICIVATAFILMIISSFLGIRSPLENVYIIYFYISIIIGFIFSRNEEIFIFFIKYFLLVNMVAMIYEFFTAEFILSPTSDHYRFLGRAKGLISYSKEAGAILLVFSLLYLNRLSPKWSLVLMVSAILSGSRLSIGFVAIAILLQVGSLDRVKKLFNLRNFLLALVIVAIFYSFFSAYYLNINSDIIIDRLGQSLDPQSSGNAERISFWIKYLEVFNDFSIVNIFFGKPYYLQSVVGNGAENAFLAILTDGGLVPVIFYLLAFFITPLRMGSDKSIIIKLILLFIAMQFSRVGLGFTDGVLFWTFVWGRIIPRRSKRLVN